MREREFDTLRSFACIWVFLGHFISLFAANDRVWRFVASHIFKGFDGSLMVSLFCVILGWFAVKSAEKGNFDFGNYVKKRYVKFLVYFFLIETISFVFAVTLRVFSSRLFFSDNILVASNIFDGGLIHAVRTVIKDIVFFKDSFIPTYWCISDMFLSSVVITALVSLSVGRKMRVLLLIIAFCIFVLVGRTQSAICLGGGISFLILREKEGQFSMWKSIILVLGAVILIRWIPGSFFLLHLKEMVISILIIVAMKGNRRFSTIIAGSHLNFWGKYSFSFYLIHVPFLSLITYFLYRWTQRILPFQWNFIFFMLVSLVLVLLMSICYERLSQLLYKRIVDKIV